MYERFSDEARNALRSADQVARRFNHEYIGTEHLLLGLVKDDCGQLARVLRNLDVDPHQVRVTIENWLQYGPRAVKQQRLEFTPNARKALACAIEEARGLGQHFIGPEHVLLGLLRQQGSMAHDVLFDLIARPAVLWQQLQIQQDKELPALIVRPPSLAFRAGRLVARVASEIARLFHPR